MIFNYKTAKGISKTWVLNAFLFSGLRRMSYRTPLRAEALTKARVKRGKYKCAECGNIFGRKQIAVDHIEPVVNVKRGFTTWDEYITRLFVPPEGLQILCNNGKNSCHKLKSKQENAERRKHKKDKK